MSEAPAALKERVCDYIRETDHVSFAELANHFAEFSGGDLLLELRHNLLLWAGMTHDAVEAMKALQLEGKIVAKPSSAVVYWADGRGLRCPIARRIQAYRKPHWLPVTFRPGKPSPA